MLIAPDDSTTEFFLVFFPMFGGVVDLDFPCHIGAVMIVRMIPVDEEAGEANVDEGNGEDETVFAEFVVPGGGSDVAGDLEFFEGVEMVIVFAFYDFIGGEGEEVRVTMEEGGGEFAEIEGEDFPSL